MRSRPPWHSFPIGRADDGAHGQNEKYDINQLLAGIKLLGTYMEEYAAGSAAGDLMAADCDDDEQAADCEPAPAPKRPKGALKRPEWAKSAWAMCGSLAEGECKCCW